MSPQDPPRTLKKGVFNPTHEDFTWEYFDDKNHGASVTIRAQEMAFYPEFEANLLITHLADKILWAEGIKTNVQDDLKRIKLEIEVQL